VFHAQANQIEGGIASSRGKLLTATRAAKWKMTADSTVTSLTDASGVSGLSISNIVGNGQTVSHNASLAANKWLDGKVYTLSGGGKLAPR
jgi:hypothetical protein